MSADWLTVPHLMSLVLCCGSVSADGRRLRQLEAAAATGYDEQKRQRRRSWARGCLLRAILARTCAFRANRLFFVQISSLVGTFRILHSNKWAPTLDICAAHITQTICEPI